MTSLSDIISKMQNVEKRVYIDAEMKFTRRSLTDILSVWLATLDVAKRSFVKFEYAVNLKKRWATSCIWFVGT